MNGERRPIWWVVSGVPRARASCQVDEVTSGCDRSIDSIAESHRVCACKRSNMKEKDENIC